MKLVITILLSTLLLTTLVEAEPTNQEIKNIINLAGKQRMLTQKMSKEALLIGKGIDVEKNQNTLKESISLFDTTLNGLLYGDKNLKLQKTEDKEIVKELQSILNLWREFKIFIDRVANGKFKRTALKAIEMGNIPLLKSMNHVVNMYEKKYESQLSNQRATTINLAGKERMLVQKITKELLLISHNLESNIYMSSLKKGGNFFKNSLLELVNNKEAMNNPEIVKEIQDIKTLWDEYEQSIMNAELSKEGVHKFNQQEKIFTQKMTSKLISVAIKIDKKRYQDELKRSTNEFETILHGLINGDKKLGIFKTKNETIQKELSHIESRWKEYKKIIIQVDTSTKALKKAMEINMPLVEDIDKVVKLYELEKQ